MGLLSPLLVENTLLQGWTQQEDFHCCMNIISNSWFRFVHKRCAEGRSTHPLPPIQPPTTPSLDSNTQPPILSPTHPQPERIVWTMWVAPVVWTSILCTCTCGPVRLNLSNKSTDTNFLQKTWEKKSFNLVSFSRFLSLLTSNVDSNVSSRCLSIMKLKRIGELCSNYQTFSLQTVAVKSDFLQLNCAALNKSDWM